MSRYDNNRRVDNNWRSNYGRNTRGGLGEPNQGYF